MEEESQQEDKGQTVLKWVAYVLAEERVAIQQQLLNYHQTMLKELDVNLRRSVSPSEPIEVASPFAEGAAEPVKEPPTEDDGPVSAQPDLDGNPKSVEAISPGNNPSSLASFRNQDFSTSIVPLGDTQANADPEAPAVTPVPDPSFVSENSYFSGQGVHKSRMGNVLFSHSHRRSISSTLLSGVASFRTQSKEKGFLKAAIESAWFEGFFVVLILINTLVAALQAQYRGFDIGHSLKLLGHDIYQSNSNAVDTWPGADDTFEALEVVFAAMYTVEIVIKLLALHRSFFCDGWNLFDFFLVCIWYLYRFGGVRTALNPLTLRLARLARLMRIVRHAGFFAAFDNLHMILTAIKTSLSVLVWATMILTTLLVICALVMNGFLQDYMEDPTNDLNSRALVYKYFGSFTRSFISMFEISFASHASVTRAIMEDVDESFAIYFLAYKLLIGLSVMKVITGVFLHETFKVCSEDDELMIIQKKRMMREHTRKMMYLFNKVDGDHSGSITRDEFEVVMSDSWTRVWMSAMDLDISDTGRLWDLVDNGDGEVTAEELVTGIQRLKGTAKSIDMNHLVRKMHEVKVVLNGELAEVKSALNVLKDDFVFIKHQSSGAGYHRPNVDLDLLSCSVEALELEMVSAAEREPSRPLTADSV